MDLTSRRGAWRIGGWMQIVLSVQLARGAGKTGAWGHTEPFAFTVVPY